MATTTPSESKSSPLDGYAPPGTERPLGAYSVLSSIFATSFVTALVAAHRAGRLPAEFSTKDIVLTGIATHKLSRLIARDKVTSFARAPFTRFQQKAGHAEVDEEPRGQRGLSLAVGELLVCPYCLAQWIAGAFIVGHVTAPRVTRLLTAMWSAHAIADAAQLAYSAAEQRS